MSYDGSAMSNMSKSSPAAASIFTDRSPLAIPPRVPLNSAFPSDQMLPVREVVTGILETDETPHDPETSSSERSASPETLRLPDLGRQHHFVILPMVSMVRGIYTARINAARSDIESYVKDISINADLTKKIDLLLADLAGLCDHRDVADVPATTVSTASAAQAASQAYVSEARWAENCSTKCLFMTGLLRSIRHLSMHVAILVRPGRMIDVVEAIMRTEHVTYERPDRQTTFKDGRMEGLHVTILTSDVEHNGSGVRRPDVIIALDPLFSLHGYSSIEKILTFDTDIVAISLVVVHSVEHVKLCLQMYDSTTLAKRQLVYCVAQLRKTAGILDNDLAQPDEAAIAVSQYLMENPLGAWPLSGSGEISGLDMIAFEPQSLSKSTAPFKETFSTPNNTTQVSKRAYSDNHDEDPAKRVKFMPTFSKAISPAAQTETRSDQHQAGDDHTKILLRKANALEAKVRDHVLKESELHALVNTLEARLADHIASVQSIAPKYQEALNERAAIQVERDIAISQAGVATAKLEACLEDIAKLKNDKARLSHELKAEQSAEHQENAEEASLKAQIIALTADKDRLERKAASTAQDFAYTRESYQKASSSAVELARELGEAQEQIVVLQRKASDNLVRIHELQVTNERAEREARIDELEAMLVARDGELVRLGQELKAKTSGRRDTRASSVPRSPRLGSVGVIAGAMSPRARGSSRQGSPAPGDLTNMRQNQFSDALLFPSGLGSASRLGYLREGM